MPASSLPVSSVPKGRIAAIDVARGVALVAMAIYHFTWDLEFFGYADPGLTAIGGWKIFARCIASSFLFLVGFSLFLAHGNGIRWNSFLKRLAMVAGAAVLITGVTYFATPQSFIFFGILHQIALASILGLLFLRLPAAALLLLAAAIIAIPYYFRAEIFQHPALWWVGLAPYNPRSNDYVPLFPWFGAVISGIAAAKFASAAGLLDRLQRIEFPRPTRFLDFIGRHSLAFYLIHQPVMIALIWLFSQIVPPAPVSAEAQFLRACQRACETSRGPDFCPVYCTCMLDELAESGLIETMFTSGQTEDQGRQVQSFAASCTIATQEQLSEGMPQ
ncbi:MAG: DUF1624 domain-containing protein [Rhizobiaceae bacterium]|nr:DUF1624 domain-containing protein [Rhizobiaceae bacterium]